MRFLVTAIAALAAALADATVVPYLGVAGAHPHVLVVAGVIWTVAAGVECGLLWGFLGGLALDVLAQRPLGSTAFVLVATMGAAALLGSSSGRARRLAVVPIAFVLSLASSLLFIVVYGALRGPVPEIDPVHVILPGALYDAVLAAAVGPLVVAVYDRRQPEEGTEW
jgi:rod shape-determining protein MreD